MEGYDGGEMEGEQGGVVSIVGGPHQRSRKKWGQRERVRRRANDVSQADVQKRQRRRGRGVRKAPERGMVEGNREKGDVGSVEAGGGKKGFDRGKRGGNGFQKSNRNKKRVVSPFASSPLGGMNTHHLYDGSEDDHHESANKREREEGNESYKMIIQQDDRTGNGLNQNGELHIDDVDDEFDDELAMGGTADGNHMKHAIVMKSPSEERRKRTTKESKKEMAGGVSSRTLQAILQDQKDRQARYSQQQKEEKEKSRRRHLHHHNKEGIDGVRMDDSEQRGDTLEASNFTFNSKGDSSNGSISYPNEHSPPSDKKQQLPEGWKRIRDPETGRFYYYNRSKEEMSYEYPGKKHGNGGLKGNRATRPGSMAYERSMRIILEGAKGADLKHQPVREREIERERERTKGREGERLEGGIEKERD